MAASGFARTFGFPSPHANSWPLADFPRGRFERPLPRQKRSVSGGWHSRFGYVAMGLNSGAALILRRGRYGQQAEINATDKVLRN